MIFYMRVPLGAISKVVWHDKGSGASSDRATLEDRHRTGRAIPMTHAWGRLKGAGRKARNNVRAPLKMPQTLRRRAKAPNPPIATPSNTTEAGSGTGAVGGTSGALIRSVGVSKLIELQGF